MKTDKFKIRHLFKEKNYVVRPQLGPFSLFEDQIKAQPWKKVEQFMKWMKQVPFLYVPLFMLPFPAFAEDVPEGFEVFENMTSVT